MPSTRDFADPRLPGDYVRRLPADNAGDVHLIGVVHDHPASTYRVRTVIEAIDPELLALELPPMAVPLFKAYASRSTATDRGGEMSAAIRAADTDSIVGVDGPARAFLKVLLSELYRNEASLDTARTVLRGFGAVTWQAAACRIAALVGERARGPPAVDFRYDYDCEGDDDPATQAEDEQSRIARTKSLMDVIEVPEAARIRDRAREAHMSARLRSLRERGTVVAVIGVDHLDSVAMRLR